VTPGRANEPRRRESFAERRERRAAIDDPAVVLEAAARFLEARSRSVAEVRRRLTGAGYRADLVDGAIERLTELGMLDDDAFARAWVESRDRARPRGERAIREELRLKGIDRPVIDAVLTDRRDAAQEGLSDVDALATSPDRSAAERLLAKNARALARVTDARQRRQRAYALLARHGFDPETCREVAAGFVEDGVTNDGEAADGP
jgi:regulatory protein